MVIEVAARPAQVEVGGVGQAVVEGARQETPLRRVRRDALPEEIRYRDDGCDIHSECLTCPLPRCRYDEPGGLRGMLNAYRDQQIVALRGDGAPVDQIAERYRLSRRTVFRILSTGSPSGPSGPSETLDSVGRRAAESAKRTRPAISAAPSAGNGGNGHRS
ncbi:MAG: helix-turn-helix domain-containing protein [Chloroflexi bacterium]|nr:helix-turn-helix domain-containing protein [Chloroflexota bacterium]